MRYTRGRPIILRRHCPSGLPRATWISNDKAAGGTSMEPGKRLPGKVAIITGGASGIGEATARIFAIHGASVVLCDLQDELGAKVAGEIVAAGGTAEYRHLDVTQEDEWTALAEAVEAKCG